MAWRYLVGCTVLVAVVAWGCSGCTVSKTNTTYKCFTKAACDNE